MPGRRTWVRADAAGGGEPSRGVLPDTRGLRRACSQAQAFSQAGVPAPHPEAEPRPNPPRLGTPGPAIAFKQRTRTLTNPRADPKAGSARRTLSHVQACAVPEKGPVACDAVMLFAPRHDRPKAGYLGMRNCRRTHHPSLNHRPSM